MKKLFLLLFVILPTILFSQNVVTPPLPLDENQKPVSVIYVKVGTDYFPVNSDTNGILSISIPGVTDTTVLALRFIGLNMPQYHYTATEVLVDSSDVGVGIAYVKYNVASYDRSTIAINFDDSTSAQFFSSIYSDPDFFDETSGDWGDITNAVVGVDSVAFGTNTNYYVTEALSPNEWILIKYKKWGTTNSIDIAIKKKGN